MKSTIMLLALTASAADKPAPKLTDAQRAAYWRANAEYVVAQARFAEADARVKAVIADLKSTCGEVTSGKDGEPVCVPPKPTASEPTISQPKLP